MPVAVLPRPALVLDSTIANWRLIVSEGWITLLESLYGFVLAFALGVPLAVAIASSRTLNLMFYPLLIATQSLPKVALAPLILVWLGTGMNSKLAIAWLVAFFPIVVDTATGLRNTPAEFLDLADGGAGQPPSRRSGKSAFRRRCRSSFPARKVAITLAVIGAVIGEFIGSNEGLGNLLLVANSQVNIPLAFACLIGLAVIGIGLYAAVAAVELALKPWFGEAGRLMHALDDRGQLSAGSRRVSAAPGRCGRRGRASGRRPPSSRPCCGAARAA